MKGVLRKPIIAANWKMHKTTADAVAFVDDLKLAVGRQLDVGVVVCPPFTALEAVGKHLEGTHIHVGAQNMHPERFGAFTGEISAEMLRHLFVSHVIIGHSERRLYFGETDAFINQKVHAALNANLKPILCIGETGEEREAGQTEAVLTRQLTASLYGLTEKTAEGLIIAYEPVWAIGTGNTATPALAAQAHGLVRNLLAELLGAAFAGRTRILYGGSMKPENAAALLREVDIDGGLIGGASLEVRSLLKLIEIAQETL